MTDLFEPGQVKILLVDDTPENLEIAGRVLAREGYDLYLADNGLRALEMARRTIFDLVLLDIMMPGLDGFDTGKQLLSLHTQQSTPMIFITARAEIDSITRGFELGAVDYIRKPYNPVELRERVRIHVQLKKLQEKLLEKQLELERALAFARSMAKTDELTGLLNRREINALMSYEMIRAARNNHEFTVILADIDFFKSINDTYGHLTGDTVLQELARQIHANVREQDFVSRWGGEEILILLPETGPEEAVEIAQRLRQNISDVSFGEGDQIFHVTMTFGVANHEPDMSRNELIRRADSALYHGKNSGRNKVVYTCGDSFRSFEN